MSPVVHRNAHLIQKENRVLHRTKFRKLGTVDKPDAGDHHIIHVGINRPAPANIAKHELHHVTGLAGAFLSEKKGKLIGVSILAGNEGKKTEKKEENEGEKQHGELRLRHAAFPAPFTDESTV